MSPFSVTIFLLLFLATTILTLTFGEVPLSTVLDGLLDRYHGVNVGWNPLLDERLPRLIVLLSSGASLAIAGAITQALFQNPLASPSVLGISAGSTLVVTPVLLMGWHLTVPFILPLISMAGALFALFLVHTLFLCFGDRHTSALLLFGMALSTLFLALQGTLNYAFRDHWQLLQTLTELEAGSTLDRNWNHVHLQAPLTIVGIAIAFWYRLEIDILSLGDEEALTLGVSVSKVRWRLFLAVSLLVGGAMAAVGSIGFFGFLLPCILRKIYGPNNQRLIPLCGGFGALTLAGMDLMLRIFNIYTFSLGNLSAIIGGIFFLFLLCWKFRLPHGYQSHLI